MRNGTRQDSGNGGPAERSVRLAYASLALASLLFGATFVVVKEAIATLPPYGFVGWRFLLGAALLLVISPPRTALVWRDGVIAGSLLYAGYIFQTLGLQYTSASNSGLITGLYVVLTPLLAALVGRHAPRVLVLLGAAVALGGFGMLTLQDGLALQRGDLMTVAAAVGFSGHIVFLARVARRHPVLPFTAVQLLTTALAGLTMSAGLEGFPLPEAAVWPALLITGILVSAGAFYLQVWSQTVVGPARTAIVLALEPAFAAATGAIVLGERLGLRGWLGAGLILLGIYAVLGAAGSEDELPAAEAITPAH